MNIKYATLKILILLAYADKEFHENEKKMIIKISKKNDLPNKIPEKIKIGDPNPSRATQATANIKK